MTTRDRIVLLVVIGIAALGAFWFLALSPKRTQASSLQGQITAAQQRLDTANSQIAQSRNAQSTYTAAVTTLARLGKAVPSDDQVPSLLFELNSAANASGVSFDRFQTGGAAAPSVASTATASKALSGIQPMPFSFSFQGNFFHLEGFFRSLDQLIVANQQQITANGRLLTLDSISLSPGNGGFPNIQATVAATGFELPADATSATAATPPPALTLQGLRNGSKLPLGGAGADSSLPTATATGGLP